MEFVFSSENNLLFHIKHLNLFHVFVLIFRTAVCLVQHQRTPSVASAATATAAAVRRPPRKFTVPRVLLLAAPHPELTHSTTAHTAMDAEATRRSGQSEVSQSFKHLPVWLAGIFSHFYLGVLHLFSLSVCFCWWNC